MTVSGPSKDERIVELDSLRGIAALTVALYHLTGRYYEDYGRPEHALPAFPIEGMHGVFLFFIISGFVISRSLHGTTHGRDFVLSRFSRIFPSFWFCGALTFFAMRTFGLPRREVSIGEALVNLTMLQDHFGVRTIDQVYWSLTVELSFYVLAFLAHARGWLSRYPHRLVWAWLAYSLVLVLAGRSTTVPFLSGIERLTLPTFSPLFAAGVMFFLLRSGVGSLQTHAVIGVSYVLHNFFHWHGKSGLALSLAMYASFYLLTAGRLRLLRARPTVFLGAISYPLYLLHDNLGLVVIRTLVARGIAYPIALFAAIALALALATFVTYKIERPAMRWLRAAFGRKREPGITPSPARPPAREEGGT